MYPPYPWFDSTVLVCVLSWCFSFKVQWVIIGPHSRADVLPLNCYHWSVFWFELIKSTPSNYIYLRSVVSQSWCPCVPRRGSMIVHLLGLQVWSQPRAWMSVVCFECCVLSDRGICNGPITCPEESDKHLKNVLVVCTITVCFACCQCECMSTWLCLFAKIAFFLDVAV